MKCLCPFCVLCWSHSLQEHILPAYTSEALHRYIQQRRVLILAPESVLQLGTSANKHSSRCLWCQTEGTKDCYLEGISSPLWIIQLSKEWYCSRSLTSEATRYLRFSQEILQNYNLWRTLFFKIIIFPGSQLGCLQVWKVLSIWFYLETIFSVLNNQHCLLSSHSVS